MIDYHDTVWGTPLHDDKRLFEYFVLDIFQAGLNWRTILYKQVAFRNAFDDFELDTVAAYGEREIARLMSDASIIRNRRKIEATISNARAIQKISDEFGSFDKYLWHFVHGRPLNHGHTIGAQLESRSPESDAMSTDMRKRGLKFIGTTICYAFMQSAGLVNDHIVTCPRYLSVSSG